MEQTITADELARCLEDVLYRVRERNALLIVEVRGGPVANLVPIGPRLGVPLHEALDAMGGVEVPGDGFADDLEAVQAGQSPARFLTWPS